MKLITMTEKEYMRIHDYVRRKKPYNKTCEHCGLEKKLDNAVVTGKSHEKNIDNYIQLCRICHNKYDYPNGKKHSKESIIKIGIASSKRISVDVNYVKVFIQIIKKNIEKMYKLIGMTDFVLEQRKIHEGDFEDLSDLYFRYAKFLKQPLELWMFVPCDEDGNVLDEPTEKDEFRYYNGIEYYPHQKKEYLQKYQKAKDRCLFDGLDLGVANHHIRQERKVEYLANFGILELTKASIKQLGL